MNRQINIILKPALFLSALFLASVSYGNVEKTLQYSSKANPGDQVYFSGDNANITIVKGDSNDVIYDVKMVYTKNGKSNAQKAFDKVEWTFTEGSKICLEEKIKKHTKAKYLKIYVTLTLPDEHHWDVSTVNGYIETEDGFNTDVTVASVNGDITLKGDIAGSLSANNVNGLIQAGNIGGDCNVRAVNGRIKVGSVNGTLEANNVNGNTTIGKTESEVSSSSVNGGISLILSKETDGSVSLKSVNGDLKVKCPESLGTTVFAKSSNGSLSCNKSLKITKIKKNRLEGTSGDGSVNLKIKSLNGNVTIETN